MGTPVFDAIFYTSRGFVDAYMEKEYPPDNAETSAAWKSMDEKICEVVPKAHTEELYQAVLDYTRAAELLAFRNGIRLAVQLRAECLEKEAR